MYSQISYLNAFRGYAMFFVMAVAMLAFGDQFPFSNFPMYSFLPGNAFFMKLTDDMGRMIPSVPAFGISTSTVKKQMVREMREIKEKESPGKWKSAKKEAATVAGQRALEWLLKNHPARAANLAGTMICLEQTTFSLKRGKIEQETERVGRSLVPEPNSKSKSDHDRP